MTSNQLHILPDIMALLFFITVWTGYVFFVKRISRKPELALLMHEQRRNWMHEMSKREARVADAAIVNILHAGAAFFASTAIIAIGGAATLLHSADDAIRHISDLPFIPATSRRMWDVKSLGLMIVYGYAFFKFAWSYRLFNYAAILVGATPAADCPDSGRRERAAIRAASMTTVAGSAFVSGQRAMFFSFAYLGWYLGPYVFMMTTVFIVCVLYNRQYHSRALKALMPLEQDFETPDSDNSGHDMQA